jgi:hypothetical protein
MAELLEPLWKHNLAKVVVVDVTDDYRLMQPPLPSDLYPVLKETYLPKYKLIDKLPAAELVHGYLYDWHESPDREDDCWYVGVVLEELANELLSNLNPMQA